jgi:hypothetical protein
LQEKPETDDAEDEASGDGEPEDEFGVSISFLAHRCAFCL